MPDVKTEIADIYRKLQEHLDSMPVGFPATESGVELRILKHLFTPLEAEIGTKLGFIPEPVKNIYRRAKRMGISQEDLSNHLVTMFKKGCINGGRDPKTGDWYFATAPIVVGMFEYQLNRLDKGFVDDAEAYLDEFIGEYFENAQQLRTIPQEKSIVVDQGVERENFVAPYDDVLEIIENARPPYAVATCICRQVTEIQGRECPHLKEVCLQFSNGARLFLEMGLSREISKDEVKEILKKAQEDGLVIQPFNNQRPIAICCCCGDACGILLRLKKYPNPGEIVVSNYYSEVDPDACTGCAICQDRCPMDAIEVDGVSSIIQKRCIGCGVCVPTCPEDAIHLVKKPEQVVPAPSTSAMYMDIMKKKAALARQAKQ